ncbi:MAG: hypothetical protein MAG453_01180 [Calditrichaeota bacterium]|nr:hypothetical protein [Calditrichota bacterium]
MNGALRWIGVFLLAAAVSHPPVSAQSRRAPASQSLPPGDWHVTTGGPYIIYHEPQDEQAAADLLALYERLGPEFSSNLGLEVPDGTRVFIAPSEGRFRLLTRGTPHWTGGLAYPRRRLIVLQSPRMIGSRGQFSVTALHELVHVITSHTGARNLPRWLGEGFAMYLSGETMYKNRTPLARAVVFNKTYTLDGIEGMMRLGPEQARVAYLQSISFVEFIVDRYGWDAIAALIKGYQSGADPDSLFRDLTGSDLYDVEIAFHEDLRDRYRWFNVLAWINFDTLIWTGAAVLVTFVGTTIIIRRRRELHSEESYIDESQADPRLYEWHDDPPPGEWYVDEDETWR